MIYLSFFSLLLTMLATAGFSYGQELPSSIRGYKVHRIKIQVRTAGESASNRQDPTVNVGQPEVVYVSLEGLTLQATAEVSGLRQNGRVDSLMFQDVAVNGIPLRIDDYEHPFDVTGSTTVKLPFPVRATVSTSSVAKAAYKEATDARDEWQVSGTVFVFGRFKRMGFTFKRVIPVPIDLTIPNPLKTLAKSR